MSVINPAPTEVARFQLLKAVADQKQQIQNLFAQVLLTMNNTAGFVYQCPVDNGNGGTFGPQDVMDAYGVDAADLVNLSAAFVGAVAAYTGQPVPIPPPGFSLTPDPASPGKIIVTYTAPTPPGD